MRIRHQYVVWLVVAAVVYALYRSNRSATTQATVPYDAASGTFLTPDYAPPSSFSGLGGFPPQSV